MRPEVASTQEKVLRTKEEDVELSDEEVVLNSAEIDRAPERPCSLSLRVKGIHSLDRRAADQPEHILFQELAQLYNAFVTNQPVTP